MSPSPAPVPAALAAILVLTSALAAQTTEGDLVPRDLVVALLGDADVDLRVGELPEGLPSDLPLPPGRLVGSLARSWGAQVVVEVDGPAEQALASYRQTLTASGYRPPPSPGRERGGFQSSDSAGMLGLCGEDGHLNVSSSTVQGRSYLRVQVRTGERTACDAASRFGRRPPRNDWLIPSLAPPPEARVRSAGMGRSSTREETDATLATDMEADAVAAAYAEQLEAAGWTPAGRAGDAGMSLRRWTVLDTDGESWTGLLVVWAVSDGYLSAQVRVERPQPVP